MRVIILVGGEGTRLRPLTYAAPKQMLPILGRPMIEWVFENLSHHGVTDVTLSLGYLPDAFVAAYPDGEIAGIKVGYAVEPERLDTAGAIKFAATAAGITETFAVLNGDVMTTLDLTRLFNFHLDREAEATIALHEVEDPSAFGVVPTDELGRVLDFIEKPTREDAPTNLINAGTYIFEPSVLDLIESGRKVSVERETFPVLVERGRLFALPGECYWLDAGTPAAYLKAHFDLLDGLREIPEAWGARTDTGFVALGVDGDQHLDISGTIVTPTYLGLGAHVGHDALVERSMIGAGVSIGAGAVVRNSVLHDGAFVAAGAQLDHAIVGARGVIGDRAVLTNNTVIGAGFVVEPGTVLTEERVPV